MVATLIVQQWPSFRSCHEKRFCEGQLFLKYLLVFSWISRLVACNIYTVLGWCLVIVLVVNIMREGNQTPIVGLYLVCCCIMREGKNEISLFMRPYYRS